MARCCLKTARLSLRKRSPLAFSLLAIGKAGEETLGWASKKFFPSPPYLPVCNFTPPCQSS
jgi:hypothetical protein